MAIRIPTYERHVQLDSGAQTIPRFQAETGIGKALSETGNSIMKVAAHWQAKQDSFDKMQMGQRVTELAHQIQLIHQEEILKFNPGVDRPGTLHDRIQERVAQAVEQFNAQAPPNLSREYRAHSGTYLSTSSMNGAHEENNSRNTYGKSQIDSVVATLKQQVEKNPDSADQAIAQARQAIRDYSATSGFTDAQKAIIDEANVTSIAKSAGKGFAAQGRTEDGQAWAKKFAADRNAEEIGKVKATVDPSRYDTKLSPDDEQKFQDWKAKFAPNDSGKDYDLRGAFKAGVEPDPNTGHMPDTFKKPNHPTFSNESQYAGDRPDLAGKWDGDTFIPPAPPVRGGPAPGPQSGGPTDTKLNQNRIAQIDANPEAKAAIEKAAQATGLDPNMLKVFASIESSGNPKVDSPGSGKYKGLFQLGNVEFGLHNGGQGDIHNADDNAMAAAKLLVQRKGELTQQLGREPTPTELYSGHQQGMGGTVAHINNPDQPAWKSLMQTAEGREKGEGWAKQAISGNMPKDVLDRLYGGDVNRVSSRDFMAVQSSRVKGGSIDQAIQEAQGQQAPQAPRTVVASADGSVISESRPPAYVGGVNVGGQGGATQAPVPGRQTAPNVIEATAGKIRSQPIADDLKGSLNYAAGRNGVRVQVVSGGQDPQGQEGVSRTGSHRHDDGGAADVVLYDTKDGHKLDMTNEADRLRMGAFVTDAVRTGVTGVGGATNYMGNNTLHLGGGSTATWGAKGEPAPTWIQQAHNDGLQTKLQPEAATAAKAIPVQVAQAGGAPVVPGAAPAQAVVGSKWDQLSGEINTMLDGSQMKSGAIAAAMKSSLEGRVKADIASTQLNGNGIQLPKELQDYYHTPSTALSYDLIANKLGTGRAIQWQQDKDFSQKVYNGGAHMEDMPRDVIIQRLQGLAPDPNSPYFLDQSKVYNEVMKKAQAIDKQRNADPAGYADKDPAVQAALKAAREDPQNEDKTQALITARMNRQQQLGIADALRTPITTDEAKILSQPLLDRARPDRDSAGAEVANNIIKFVGKGTAEGVPDLAHRALQTVLKTKNITDQQAAATADALVAAQHPPPPPLVPGQNKPKNYDLNYMSKDGYYVNADTGFPSQYGPNQTSSDPNAPDATTGFQPGTKFIPSSHIEALRKDPSLADMFDNGTPGQPGYGKGAADYFLKGGVNAPSQPVYAPPKDELSQAPSPDNVLMPQQADPLAPGEDPTQTLDENVGGE